MRWATRRSCAVCCVRLCSSCSCWAGSLYRSTWPLGWAALAVSFLLHVKCFQDWYTMSCVRWSPCLSTWRRGSEGTESASTSLLSPCSSTSSPRSRWVFLSEGTALEERTVCASRPPSALLSVSPGGHVFRSCVYPAGFRVEHLRCRHRSPVNHSPVHCYRYLDQPVCLWSETDPRCSFLKRLSIIVTHVNQFISMS